MALDVKAKTTGGARLKRHLREVEQKRRAHGRESNVEVGFFDTARYQNGVPVAAVAAWNEFGVDYGGLHIPSRPFFREAVRVSKDKVKREQARVDVLPEKKILERIGLIVETEIKRQIKTGDWTPNVPSVTARKAAKSYAGAAPGSPKPLIDEGDLFRSATSIVKMRE